MVFGVSPILAVVGDPSAARPGYIAAVRAWVVVRGFNNPPGAVSVVVSLSPTLAVVGKPSSACSGYEAFFRAWASRVRLVAEPVCTRRLLAFPGPVSQDLLLGAQPV